MGPEINDFDVGWICALPIEAAAAIAILDEKYQILSPQNTDTDDNVYAFGRIGHHQVVIGCLPAGLYGTTSATDVAVKMNTTFPSIKVRLMVGIGGGAPSEENDIRLGDVVVSQPSNGTGGCVQYDFGKRVEEDDIQLTGHLDAPPRILLKASASLQAENPVTLGQRISEIVLQIEHTDDRFSYPDSDDRLFRSDYFHEKKLDRRKNSCKGCDPKMEIFRRPREHDIPRVYYGIIASGNQVIRDAITRDKISSKTNAICFEMEAAGLMNLFPSLVIRGICDYSDSHKNKAWQPYAAIVAAAYAKELLCLVPSQSLQNTTSEELSLADQELLQALSDISSDPKVEKMGIERRKGTAIAGSCRWVKENEDFKNWFATDYKCRLLQIIGDAGKGKTMIMMSIINELSGEINDSDIPTLELSLSTKFSYVFCQATDEKFNNATSVLGALLLRLLKSNPNLARSLREHVGSLTVTKSFKDSFNLSLIQTLIYDVIRNQACPNLIFIIDALDECIIGLPDLVNFICRSLEQFPKVKWLISSRPQEDVRSGFAAKKYQANIGLEGNKQFIDAAIEAYISFKVDELDKRKQYAEKDKHEIEQVLREKCGGTFLWVHLACKELEASEALSIEAVSVLDEFPPELTDIYSRMLAQIKNYRENRVSTRCFNILTTAVSVYRPLHLREMSVIANIGTDHIPDLNRLVTRCGSFLTVQDDYIYFIHQSAKDYLAQGHLDMFMTSSEDCRHSRLLDSCFQILSTRLRKNIAGLAQHHTLSKGFLQELDTQTHNILLELRYACCHWAKHLEEVLSIAGCDWSPKKVALKYFFENNFLHWLEALSLIGSLPESIVQINILKIITLRKDDTQEIHDIAMDAENFIHQCYSTIETAPLQIYSSALHLSPQKSLIRRMNLHQASEWLSPVSSTNEDWDLCQKILQHPELPGEIASLACSADGKLIATLEDTDLQRFVRVWDAMTGVCIHNLTVYRSNASLQSMIFVSFSPDARYLGFKCGDHLQVWDTIYGRTLLELPQDSNEQADPPPECRRFQLISDNLVFSPDSTLISFCSGEGDSGDSAQVWSIAKRRCIRRFSYGYPSGEPADSISLVFDRHNTLLMFGRSGSGSLTNEETQWLWNSETKRCLVTSQISNEIPSLTQKASQCFIGSSGVAGTTIFAPDGTIIAFITNSCCAIQLLDVENGVISSFNESAPIDLISFSPDSKLIVSSHTCRTIRVWDVRDRKCIWILNHFPEFTTAFPRQISPAVFSSDQKFIVTGRDGHRTRVWRFLSEQQQIILNPHRRQVVQVLLSPDASIFATASEDFSKQEISIALWDTKTGQCKHTFKKLADSPSFFVSFIFSPNSQQLTATSIFGLNSWNTETGNYLDGLSSDRLDVPKRIQFSPDSTIMAASFRHEIRVWSLVSGQHIKTLRLPDEFKQFEIILFSLKYQLIAATFKNGISTFDSRHDREMIGYSIPTDIANAEDFELLSAEFSPRNPSIVATCSNGDLHWFTIRPSTPETAEEDIQTKINYHFIEVPCAKKYHGSEFQLLQIAFSPDGGFLISTSPDFVSRLWDPVTKECLRILRFPNDLPARLDCGSTVIWNSNPACKIEFSDDKLYFADRWRSKVIVPHTISYDTTIVSEPPHNNTVYSLYLTKDGLYAHGERIFHFPWDHRAYAFDFRNGILAIGAESGKVWLMKLNVDFLQTPAA